MSFRSDLAGLIEQELANAGIEYEDDLDLRLLTARYFELMTRRIVPAPRRVHFSNELNDSLGKLLREPCAERVRKAEEAWQAVFLIRQLLAEGRSVTGFLSTKVNKLTFIDGLLWDFGIHHFHLSTTFEASGFVKRSDYLLFAIVTNADAYFLDIRPHQDPDGLQWVRQDLLNIAYSNWPNVVQKHLLHGILPGSNLTDEEVKELRRKNVNHAANLGNKVVAPMGGGMMTDGSSTLCRLRGMQLLGEIDRHQAFFDSPPAELLAGLKGSGIDVTDRVEFRLMPLESLNPSAELLDALNDRHCLSRKLSEMGFAVVEAMTNSPVVVSLTDTQ